MPHRTLTLEEVARYLHLTAEEIERLCNDREIPFETRGGRVIFRQRDIDTWATQRILRLNPHRLAEYHQKSSQQTRPRLSREALLPDMLRPAGIAAAMAARTKASVVRDLAAVADRTGLVCDVAELVGSLQEREKLCSTAVPGGVAFLHPRQPQPFLFQESFLVFGRTIQPIHFGSPDGQPTDLFFLLCCQDDQLHLHTLARLCLMTHKTDLLARLRAAPGTDGLFDCLLAAEEAVVATLGTRARRKARIQTKPASSNGGGETDSTGENGGGEAAGES